MCPDITGHEGVGEEVSKMEDKAEHDADYERSVEGDLGEPSVQQNQLC